MDRTEPDVAIDVPTYRLRDRARRTLAMPARAVPPRVLAESVSLDTGDQLYPILILLATLAMLPAVASTAAVDPRVPAGWKPDVRAARAYAAQREGGVSFSVRTRERVWGHRPRRSVNSASVIKAMLLVAYLDHPDVRGRPLRDDDRALLAPMIRYSDNDTATAVLGRVGAPALERLARRARMRDFRFSPIWGLSQITAGDQSRYFLRLPELVVRRHRAYARKLLAGIVPEQRWGIAKVRPRGWQLAFKGGWGSGTGLVSHQVALLERGRQRVAVAIMTTGSPDHEYSQQTLRGVAARLLRGLAKTKPAPARSPAPPPSPRPAPAPSPVPASVARAEPRVPAGAPAPAGSPTRVPFPASR